MENSFNLRYCCFGHTFITSSKSETCHCYKHKEHKRKYGIYVRLFGDRKEYEAKTKERRYEIKRKHRQTDKGKATARKYSKLWKSSNPEAAKINQRRGYENWYKRHPEKSYGYFKHREDTIKRITPLWTNKTKLYEIYSKRREMNKGLGRQYKYEIDHIIPVSNNLICGLHIPDNLQIILKSKNRSKWNKFEPQFTSY